MFIFFRAYIFLFIYYLLYQSPSPCIRGVLQRTLVVTSPRKCLTKKYPWSEAEDRATVQFIAMHKDEQATDNEWPAMRSEAEYWSLAARYIKSSTGVQYLRKGKCSNVA